MLSTSTASLREALSEAQKDRSKLEASLEQSHREKLALEEELRASASCCCLLFYEPATHPDQTSSGAVQEFDDYVGLISKYMQYKQTSMEYWCCSRSRSVAGNDRGFMLGAGQRQRFPLCQQCRMMSFKYSNYIVIEEYLILIIQLISSIKFAVLSKFTKDSLNSMSLEEVEQVDASNCSMNDEEFIEVKNLALMKQSNQMGNFPPPLRQFSPFSTIQQFRREWWRFFRQNGKQYLTCNCASASLSIEFNRIGNRGCKHLTRTYLPRLTHLNLCNNLIGEGGLLHLSKRKWENMTDYNVGQLESKEMGLGWFRRTHFPKMRMLNISQDVFHMHEVRNLLLFSWKAIYIIEIAHRRGLASSRRAWTFQQESYEEKQLKKARELFQLKFPQVGVL